MKHNYTRVFFSATLEGDGWRCIAEKTKEDIGMVLQREEDRLWAFLPAMRTVQGSNYVKTYFPFFTGVALCEIGAFIAQLNPKKRHEVVIVRDARNEVIRVDPERSKK